MASKIGVILLNLGTPERLDLAAVRSYLAEFLSDPRVIDIPAVARWLLLHGIILRTRPRQSLEAYRTIWTESGSPIKDFGLRLTQSVQNLLGDRFDVVLAMRYGSPSIPSVLDQLADRGMDRIVVVPLYPQYAASSTGTALELLYRHAAKQWNVPSLSVVAPFYRHPLFIKAWNAVLREELPDPAAFDFYLFSFHGLPERHIRKSDRSGHCLSFPDCCISGLEKIPYCYRAQCYETAQQMAHGLGLSADQFAVSFQSRLGRTPWLKPYTDKVLAELPGNGARRVAVLSPAFVADCLETIEELGVRGRETFMQAGGTDYHWVPSLNDRPVWAEAVAAMVREQAGALPVEQMIV
ncbi:MAG: ferrochelatase [Acidobacteria bacterium]|nr:ferrochelatase [Acidobacteriota bacterium]MCB9396506.1 ferrochelatase [Acidobacteriota bacterium]